MNAGATQQAPQKGAGRPDARAQRASGQAAKESKSMKQKLHDLPQAAGAAIMIALLAAALLAGNFRALQNATPKAFLKQGDVKSIVEDRLSAAHNVLTVAERAALDAAIMQDARNAMNALEAAKTAREISRADQALSAAVSELTTAQLSETDARSMQKAADSFAEMGSFLRQEARAFDEQAKKAERLYDGLPAKFLLAEPDRYEGL